MFLAPAIHEWILDILFPRSCIGCGADGTWLCDQCLCTIPIENVHLCPICRRAQSNGAVCQSCSDQTALAGLIACTPYDAPCVQAAIHALKYSYIEELAGSLGTIAASALRSVDNDLAHAILNGPGSCVITEVPLHPKRERERGFNQSALLAKKIGGQFGIEYAPGILKRIRYTQTQARLDKKARLQNTKNAFRAARGFKKSQKNVILIDDVATTLSTLNECALALQKIGITSVWGVVIARGSR